MSAFQGRVLGAVLTSANSATNRRVPAPTIVADLTRLARDVAAVPRAGRGERRVLGTAVERVISAKTLHFLREAGLYQDDDGVQPVWPHAGMLVLNPMLGCSFGCVYCFRADEQRDSVDWFLQGSPTQVIDEETVVDRLGRHPLFVPGRTQLGLHTATTEPFLPQVRASTFRLLELLQERGWRNDVMIITKHFLREQDVERLASFTSFQILLFLTHNAAPAEMETMGASAAFLEHKRRTVEYVLAQPRLSAAHYFRPIVPGWNDSDEQLAAALRFGEPLGLTVIGGLKEIPNLDQVSRRRGLAPPAVAAEGGAKYFPPELVERILTVHRDLGLTSTLVGDQSCGLTVMLSKRAGKPVPNVEATRMYDLVTGRSAKCLALCPPDQLAACSAPPAPTRGQVEELLVRGGVESAFEVRSDGLFLRSPDQPGPGVVESLAAHLSYAVFWEPDRTAPTAPLHKEADTMETKLHAVLRGHMPADVGPDRLDPDDKLVDLGIDSLRLVELIIALEEEFQVLIPDEEMLAENFQNVGTVAALVDRLAAAAA